MLEARVACTLWIFKRASKRGCRAVSWMEDSRRSVCTPHRSLRVSRFQGEDAETPVNFARLKLSEMVTESSSEDLIDIHPSMRTVLHPSSNTTFSIDPLGLRTARYIRQLLPAYDQDLPASRIRIEPLRLSIPDEHRDPDLHRALRLALGSIPKGGLTSRLRRIRTC